MTRSNLLPYHCRAIRKQVQEYCSKKPYRNDCINALDLDTGRDAHVENVLLSLERGFYMYDLYNRENSTILDQV